MSSNHPFFNWRTNSFRGKSIVKIVTPVDMRLIQMSLAFQPNKKNTCHSSGYIGAMDPLRQEVYRENATFVIFPGNRIVPSLKLTWSKTEIEIHCLGTWQIRGTWNPTASLHLKSGGWKMNFLFGVRGELLVFGVVY